MTTSQLALLNFCTFFLNTWVLACSGAVAGCSAGQRPGRCSAGQHLQKVSCNAMLERGPGSLPSVTCQGLDNSPFQGLGHEDGSAHCLDRWVRQTQ
eukprot:2088199-Amphidinium_carterae.3